jgi:hypothetical protein
MREWRYWKVHNVAHLYEGERAICGYSVGFGNTNEAPEGMKRCSKCDAKARTEGQPQKRKKK